MLKDIPKHKHFGNRYILKSWGKYYLCDFEGCNQEFQSWKRVIVNAVFWKWKWYVGRGEIFISDINGLWNMIGGGAMGIIGYQLVGSGELHKLLILPAIWFAQKILVFVLGFMDYHHWHIYQNEAASTFQFSPPAVETLTRLRNMEKIVAEQSNKPYDKNSVLDNIQKK